MTNIKVAFHRNIKFRGKTTNINVKKLSSLNTVLEAKSHV